MKKNNIATTIGTINLNDIEFIDNQLSIIVGIDNVSDNLKAEINRAIEKEKIISATRWEETIKEVCTKNTGHEKELKDMLSFKTIWSEDIVITNIYLSIDLESNKEIKYSIDVNFYDRKNRLHEGGVSIAVDLSEFQNELKKIIVKAMIDRFF